MSLLSIDTSAFRESPAIRVWRNPNYALFMSGLGPYYVTSWMQRVGVGWLGWELTHSYAWLGAIAAADMVPMMVLGPFAGALADRSDPSRLLRWSQILMALQGLALAMMTIFGMIEAWGLLVLSLVSGAVQPVYTAARQTIVPAPVPREDYPSAVTLDSSMFHGSRFIGPVLAALAIPSIGVGGTFLVHTAGCLFFLATCSRMTLALGADRGRRRSGIFTEIGEGLAYAGQHVGLLPLFLMLMVTSIVARPMQDLLPGFAGGVFHAGASGLAWLTSSMGVGSLLAALFLATRGHVRGLTYLAVISTCGLGLATFGFVASRDLPTAVMFCLVWGFTLTLMGVSVQAMAQIAVADAMRGRVMILYAMIYRGLPGVGAILIGIVAEHIGLRSAFALAGLACLLVWLAIAPRYRAIDTAMNQR